MTTDRVLGSRADRFTEMAITEDPTLRPALADPPLELAEPNDTLAQAPDFTPQLEQQAAITLSGAIGDNLYPGPGENDVDLARFELDAGRVVVFDAGTEMDTIVRVFDANGTEVAANWEYAGAGPMEFTVPVDGTYTVGVSSFYNGGYDPTIEGSGFDGWYTGPFTLKRPTHP